jgi:hypothetical protein
MHVRIEGNFHGHKVPGTFRKRPSTSRVNILDLKQVNNHPTEAYPVVKTILKSERL